MSHLENQKFDIELRFFLFVFQAIIFDRRQNLTFDIDAALFLKNPNLLVIPKSWFTVNLQWSQKVKTLEEKTLQTEMIEFWQFWLMRHFGRRCQKAYYSKVLCTQYYFTQHHLQFLLTKVLLSWRPFGNWSHKTHCGKPTFV